MDLVGGAAVELELAGQRQRVGMGLAKRLAGVARLEHRERVRLGLDQLAKPCKDASALERRHPGPVAVQGGMRGADRGVDVVCGAARELGEGQAIARIDHRDRLAAAGLLPRAADQDLPLDHPAPAPLAVRPDRRRRPTPRRCPLEQRPAVVPARPRQASSPRRASDSGES